MLKPKKRITKQEIERDPILEKTVEIEKFIRHNARNLVIAVVVLAVVILGAIFMLRSNNQKTLDASGKLGIAQLSIQSGDLDDGILRLEELIDDFGGTKSAGAAHILLGQVYIEKGDYETAEKYYSDYIKKYKDELAKSSAYKALGVCAESKGDWAKATDNYKKAVNAAEYKFQKQIAQLSLANAYIEAKDFTAATKLLKTLSDSEPEYNVKNQVDMLSAKLAVLNK